MSLTIAWNFRYMCKDDDKFPCTWDLLKPYQDRIVSLESCTRSEIESHKNSNHGWKNDCGLGKDMRKRASRIPVLTDKRMSQIELSGKCRAFGFYQENVFHFIFLDREHEACEVKR